LFLEKACPPFLKILIITPNKQTVQPEDAFEDTAFKLGLEIVRSYTRLYSLSSSLLGETDSMNGFLTLSSIR
jgi:hypothetical protein